MKTLSNFTERLVERVANHLAQQSIERAENKTIRPRRVYLETLESRILYSGAVPASPEPAPTEEPAPAQEQVATSEDSAPASPNLQSTSVENTIADETSMTVALPEQMVEEDTSSMTETDTEAMVQAATQRWIENGPSGGEEVSTDKLDYAPGELVTITASQFEIGSTILFAIADDPNDPGDDGEADVYAPFYVTDGLTDDLDGLANGEVIAAWMVPTDNNGTGSGTPDALHATLNLTALGTGLDGAMGTDDDQVAMTIFTDAGSPYSIDFAAADPTVYIPNIPFPGVLTAPTGRGDGDLLIPLAEFNDGNTDVKIESLAPADMALGQIVPFETKITVSGDTTPENGTITVQFGWGTTTSNGGDFGFDETLGVIGAFIDTGDGAHFDPEGDATVDSFTWSVVGNEIVGTFTISGLDDGDTVVLEPWLALEDTIPEKTGGNVQSGLIDAVTDSDILTGSSIPTGAQTVPMNKIGDFFTADVDLSVTKTGDADSIARGETLTYTIDVANALGSSVANTVVLYDELDANVTFVSASDGGIVNTDPFDTIPDGAIEWDMGALVAGDSKTVTVVVTVNDDAPFDSLTGEDLLNSVTVTTISNDTDLSNNTDTVTTDVIAPNIPPVALDDTFVAGEDDSATVVGNAISPGGVQADDFDPDGDDLSTIPQSDIAGTSGGTFSIASDGDVTFDPDGDFEYLAAGESDTTTLVYTLQDADGATATATVTVTVVGVNDDPISEPIPNTDQTNYDSDTITPLTVSTYFSDPDSTDVLTFTATGLPDGLSIDPGGVISGSLDPSASQGGSDGIYFVTVTATDTSGGFAIQTFTWTALNPPPVALDDTFTVDEDNQVTIPVLTNDSDVDGDPLTITHVDGQAISNGGAAVTVTDGSVTLSGGQLVFTPDTNFNGPVAFTYSISDGNGGGDTADVSGTVSPVNDPPVALDDTFTVDEDNQVTIPVLTNDSDVDGDPLTITHVDGQAISNGGAAVTVTDGSVTLSGGQLVFAPDTNFNGPVAFTYTISDGNGGEDTADVSGTVSPVNDPPVALDDTFTVDEDNQVTIPVLTNDSDVDGDPLTITHVDGQAISNGGAAVTVTDGSVTLSGGQLVFAPDTNFNGPVAFTYTISDGNGGEDTADVSGTVSPVNDPPVALDDTFTVDEDNQVTIPVLTNDSDVDGDSLTITHVDGQAISNGGAAVTVTDGSVTLSGGQLVFAPDTNFNGPVAFTYTISDGNGGEDTADVSGTVSPVNDPPVALDDTFTVDEDNQVTIPVLTNDSDVDGDPLTITHVDGQAISNGGAAVTVTDGSVTLSGGQLVFAPDTNFNGPVAFTYTISDGNGGEDTADVSGTVSPVNDPPVALDDTFTVDEDNQVTIPVLTNDSDVDGDTLTISHVNGQEIGGSGIFSTDTIDVADGTVTLTGGQLVFTPDLDFNGTASFTYTIEDPEGLTDTATVTGAVTPVNDPPVAEDDLFQVDENDFVIIDVLDNDSDIDGDTLTITHVDGTAVADGDTVTVSNGTIKLDAEMLVFTPAPNYDGPVSFEYEITDGNGGTDTAIASGTVINVNWPPSAQDDSFNIDEDGMAIIDVLNNDNDLDGDTLTITHVDGLTISEGQSVNVSDGTVLLDGGELVFTPNTDFHGTSTFTYTITDGFATSAANVSGSVNPIGESVTIEDVTETEGHTLTFSATLNNTAASFTLDVSTLHGTADSLDYSSISQQELEFVGYAGETVTFTVNTTSDNLIEHDEWFTVEMNNVTNSNVDISDSAVGTILDDDARPDGMVITTDVELVISGSRTRTITFDLVIEDVETGSEMGFLSTVDDADSTDNLHIERIGDHYAIRDLGGLALGTPIIGASRASVSEIHVPVSMVDGDIIIHSGINGDHITIGQLGTVGVGLIVDGGDHHDKITHNGEVILTDSKAVHYIAEEILVTGNSTLSTNSGDLVLDGNIGTGGVGNFTAVRVLGSNIASNNGDIYINGVGGDIGTYARGVLVSVDLTTGIRSSVSADNGSVSITGTGGGNGLYGTGVLVLGSDVGGEGVAISGSGGAGSLFNEGVSIQKFSTVDSGASNLVIDGTGAATGTMNRGISAAASTLSSDGGSISVDGTGGGSSSGMYGIGVQLTGVTTNTNGDGTVTFRGTGAAGNLYNEGLKIASNSQVGTVDGDILMVGTGGGSTRGNGISVSASEIAASEDGALTFTGTGSTTGSSSWGIGMVASNVSTYGGKLTLEGTGGQTGSYNKGAWVANTTLDNNGGGNIDIDGVGGGNGGYSIGADFAGGHLSVNGDGAITIDGTGATGTSGNLGVKLAAASTLDAEGGDITLTGEANGNGLLNHGVQVTAGSQATVGGDATLTIEGTSGAGSILNRGIEVSSYSLLRVEDGDLTLSGTSRGTISLNTGVSLTTSELQSTGSGNIAITGAGNTSATGAMNIGVDLNANKVTATGTGSVTITGNAGSGSSINKGVKLANGSVVSTATNNVTITGSGRGTGAQNGGVSFETSSRVATGGTGSLTVTGTGSTTGSSSNDGVLVATGAEVTVTEGTLTLTGTGGGTTGQGASVLNNGVYIWGGKVTSTAGGSIDITGNSGGGSTLNQGVRVLSSTIGGTDAGDIFISGNASSTTTGLFNTGVYILSSTVNGTGGSVLGTGGGGIGYNHGLYTLGVTGDFGGSGSGVATDDSNSSIESSGDFFIDDVDGDIFDDDDDGDIFGSGGIFGILPLIIVGANRRPVRQDQNRRRHTLKNSSNPYQPLVDKALAFSDFATENLAEEDTVIFRSENLPPIAVNSSTLDNLLCIDNSGGHTPRSGDRRALIFSGEMDAHFAASAFWTTIDSAGALSPALWPLKKDQVRRLSWVFHEFSDPDEDNSCLDWLETTVRWNSKESEANRLQTLNEQSRLQSKLLDFAV